MVEKSVDIGLNLCGLLVSGLRGRVSNEPLALNAVIMAQGTEQGVLSAEKPAERPGGFHCMYRYGINY
jgi:hypothetical protein